VKESAEDRVRADAGATRTAGTMGIAVKMFAMPADIVVLTALMRMGMGIIQTPDVEMLIAMIQTRTIGPPAPLAQMDSDPQNWVSCAICIDADGDGYRGTGCDISQDCDDSDVNNWTKCSTCKDIDDDGWYVDCDQYSTINGSDCDDSDPNNWSSCSTCQDSDGDGKRGTGCDLSEDCDDSDPQNWISCSTCQDVDGEQ